MRSFYDNSEFPTCCTSGKMECLSTVTYRVLLKTLNAPEGNVCMINTVGTERSPWNQCRPWLTQPPAGGTMFLFVFLRVTPKHRLPFNLPSYQHRNQYKQVKCTVSGASWTQSTGSGTLCKCQQASRHPPRQTRWKRFWNTAACPALIINCAD